MGNIASFGHNEESGFTRTKSLFDFDTNEIKSDLDQSRETVEQVDHNINKKLSVDYNDIKEMGVSRSNSESGFASVPSLLSMIGLESSTLLSVIDSTSMKFVQASKEDTNRMMGTTAKDVKVGRQKKISPLASKCAMAPPARKNGCVTRVEENNLYVYNAMWVCAYGSFTAFPRVFNRLSKNRSVAGPSSYLARAAKETSISAQSTITQLTAALNRRPLSTRHVRRTQLQAPLSAAAAKQKPVQNCREVQIIDAVMRRKQVKGREIQNNDINNNNNDNENINFNGGSNIVHKKITSKSKAPLPTGQTAVAATPNIVRKLPGHVTQQPPQKFTLGNPRNRKHNRAVPLPKLATMKRPKSHSLSHVVEPVAASA